MSTEYPKGYHDNRHASTLHTAEAILSRVLPRVAPVQSAIDVGCGVGTWLYVCQQLGVPEICGYDGESVEPRLLVIPLEAFHVVDLAKQFIVPKRYDMAICMEVAEHLPVDQTTLFVSMLTAISDVVLFSAAVPGQGGDNHVNEQWQSYWARLFNTLDYDVYDFVRPAIWYDREIPYWYRQNTLVFAKQQFASRINAPIVAPKHFAALDIIHPYVRDPQR